jgi:hypothetical protein
MDVVLQLPAAFVNELRDVRIAQMEEQKRKMEEEMAAKNKAVKMPNGKQPSPGLPLYGTSSLEDVIDEFT